MPAFLRFFYSFLFLFLAFIATTIGAYAIFSSQAVNRDNRVSAGTLKIQVDTDTNISGIQTNPIFDLSGLISNQVFTKQIDVLNTGSLPLRYSSQAILSTGEDILFAALKLKVGTSGGGDELYNGVMKLFSGFSTGPRLLNPGGNETLYFTVLLPDNADESLQGKSISVNFDFKASQVP